MKKVTITLESEILNFIDQQAKGNRSSYINKLLKEQYKNYLEKEMIRALQEDVKNPEYRQEIADWDSVIQDGIE
jgi:Arc/MetJ-type ribon-helix-helix transcriptional regulator